MHDYDFKSLNDKEFEVFAADLLSARDGVNYERFKPGRDQGVDGRYFMKTGEEVILQSKHWPESTLQKLVKHLSVLEVEKVRKLNPRKYVLAISNALSRSDKERITGLFTPYIESESDVVGREDLNDLLSKHPDVEKRHYKLWIMSSTVLMHLINKPIYDRSSFAVQEITENIRLYVPTENHNRALEKLESLGSVIITGPAGIGKTTLADHICLDYISRGFALVRIGEEIREAEAVYEADQEQIFYFDDFLGRNYLEALSGHEGAHIVQFMKRIAKDRKKRFVLTSRTTILNQGKILIDIFNNNNLSRNEFEVTLESFASMDRARVLYNHLWHSKLSEDHIDAIYDGRRYKEVIKHRNYNPRLIRFITDSDRVADCLPTHYWKHISNLLENPATVWQNPFESQTDDYGRAILLLVALNGKPIDQNELAECYFRYVSTAVGLSLQGKKDFLINLKHLTGSLISRTVDRYAQVRIDLFNPSIGDFILNRYVVDVPSLRTGFSCLRSVNSLKTLADLTFNALLPKEQALSIYRHILSYAVTEKFLGFTVEYISLALLELYRADLSSEKFLVELELTIEFILTAGCPVVFRDTAELLGIALRRKVISDQSAMEFITSACTHNPSSEELEQLGGILVQLHPNFHQEGVELLENAAVEYLADSVHDEFEDEEIFDAVDPDTLSEAEANLRQLITRKLTTYGLSLSDKKIDLIVDAFDMNSRAEAYFVVDEDDDRERPAANIFYLDEIDDLFDRSA